MSTHRKQFVKIKNGSDYKAKIILFHHNEDYGLDYDTFVAAPGETVGKLTVNFDTGIGSYTELDYWAVILELLDGPDKDTYVSKGNFITEKLSALLDDALKAINEKWDFRDRPSFKECQLQSDDVHHIPTLEVSTSLFDIRLNSGSSDTGMRKVDKG